MEEDLVSIISPTFNSSSFIEATIKSIQAQTYENWELLITDDCSTDNTVNIIRELMESDSRIKLFILKKNSGGGVARNNSIEKANGRYIAFCDSDDRWTPDKLETQVTFMKKHDIAFSYGSYLICDEYDNELGINICLRRLSYHKILMDNFVGCLTAMYDTHKIGKIFMPTIRKRQDWGLWMKILRICKKGMGIKKPIGLYRIRKGSVSSNKLALINYHAQLYKQMLSIPLPLGYCLYLFINVPAFIFKTIRTKIVNL